MVSLINGKKFYKTKYEGYLASKEGKISNKKGKGLLKERYDKDGYVEYCLSINGKSIYKRGHRIIAETFIPNPENKPQVNHIDGNKKNNSVDNLEWCTSSENNHHRYNNLNYEAHGKIKVYKYINNTLIEIYDSIAEARKHISYKYIKSIIENKPIYNHYYFERNKNKINVYWNGKILFTFDSCGEAGLFFNKKPNSISSKCNGVYTKSQEFSKNFTLRAETSNDYRKHT